MKPVHKTKKIDSGVSETVGYIIIFGIMMAGIALVSLYGYPLLVNQQATANIQNMERNMISLQTDINSLTFKNVPYKESTVQVSGGTLSVDKPTASTPSFTIMDGANTLFSFQPGNIHYRDDSQGAYVELLNGAVVQRFTAQTGSVMISEPRWYYDPVQQILVVPMINITADSTFSSSGISTVQMAIENEPTTLTFTNPGSLIFYYGVPVSQVYEDKYNVAWKNYWTGEKLGMPPLVTNEFYTQASFNKPVKELVVKVYTVKILNL